MPAKYARGAKAVGICQRCGRKQLRSVMVEDGYYPSMIVCAECFDARHPQERLPKLSDPVTIYKPAPDDTGIPPELSLDVLVLPDAADFGTALSSASANGTNFNSGGLWAFGSGSFVCEFWYRDLGLIDNAQFRILRARSGGGAQSGWEAQVRSIGIGTNQRTMRLLLRPSTTSFVFDSSIITSTDGNWNHYAFVVDRSLNIVYFYFNSVLVSSTSIVTAVGAVGLATSCSIMQAISGELDELRVWTGTRSAAQIAANYLTPFELPSAESNLIADFQFDEGSGLTTTDGVGGIVATLVAGGTFVPGPP